MADQYVAVQPDSSGKKIDCSELTVSSQTVERQRMVVADPTTAANLATVSAAGALKVDGSGVTQPVSGTFWQATQPVSGTVTGNQGTANTAANAWPAKVTDGTNTAAVKAASTASVATDPALVVAISPNSEVAKGTQASAAVPTQDLKDSGRSYVAITVDAAPGVSTEALQTIAINRALTTSSATSYTVTTGKTLRIQSISATVIATSSTAIGTAKVRLRAAASTISAASAMLVNLVIPAIAATVVSGMGSYAEMCFPDGIEVASTTQIAITQVVSAATGTVTVQLNGYEY